MATSRRFFSGLSSAPYKASQGPCTALHETQAQRITRTQKRSFLRIIEFSAPWSLFGRENAGEFVFNPRVELEQVVDNSLHVFTAQRIDVQGGFFRFRDEFWVGQSFGERGAKDLQAIFRGARGRDIDTHDGSGVDGPPFEQESRFFGLSE